MAAEQKPAREAGTVIAAASFWLNAAGLMMSEANPAKAMRAVAAKITLSALSVDADTNWLAFQGSRLVA